MENAKLTSVAIVNKLDLLTNRWMRLVKRKIMGGGTEKPRNMDFMGTSFESHKIAKPRWRRVIGSCLGEDPHRYGGEDQMNRQTTNKQIFMIRFTFILSLVKISISCIFSAPTKYKVAMVLITACGI